MGFLNLATVRLCTESEGPGRRFAIWVQGCLKHCEGCCNPEMQEIRQNIVVQAQDLIGLIAASKEQYQIEGVTFVGGEPFLQAEGCAEVAHWCRQNDLSVLTFSGYRLDELKDMHNIHIHAFLSEIDVLVDGPFIIDQYDYKRDWVGSVNQKVWYLTDRYDSSVERTDTGRQTEFLISDSDILINGWPINPT